MNIKTDEEVEKIRASSLMVSKVLAYVASIIKEGITPYEINKKAEVFFKEHGVIPSFKGYKGFPAALCISTNNAVVHGIPKKVPILPTDIISVDCGAYIDGYHGDGAYTFALQGVSIEVQNLLKTTKESLELAVKTVKAGVRQGDLGEVIQKYCESRGYSVVRELVGHGLGRTIHEPPDVPNFGRAGKGLQFKKNLIIAIEPMINLGKKDVVLDDDNWTILTKDGKPSAHFEHTVCVGLDSSENLTTFDLITEEIKKNKELLEI